MNSVRKWDRLFGYGSLRRQMAYGIAYEIVGGGGVCGIAGEKVAVAMTVCGG
jgi:hypothetical protein